MSLLLRTRLFRRNAALLLSPVRHNSSQSVVQGVRFRSLMVVTYLGGFASGVASVLGIGYGIYHFSGLKRAVDTFSPAMKFLELAGQQMTVDKVPTHALGYLRKAAKSYVAYIPGAGFIVDRTFDRIDEAVDAHAEQANEIIGQAYLDIFRIVQHGGNKHETHSTLEILAVCRRLLEDLGGLGMKAGAPLVERLDLDKKVQAVSVAAGNLVDTVRAKSPEWKDSAGDFATKASGSLRDRIGWPKKVSEEPPSDGKETK